MDIYFAGGVYQECTDEIRKLGCHQLLSQLEKKNIASWVEYKRANPDCKSKLMIDSGAFTAYTKGKEVDVDKYIDFMNDIDDVIDYYIQVDKIPGRWGQDRNSPEYLKEAIESPKISWDNFLYMREKAKSPHKLLPVFHQGEDVKWLEQMLEYKDENGKALDYICISSSKDLPKKSNLEWFHHVWAVIRRSSNPKVKVHALGLMQLKTLTRYTFASSDSTSWIQTGANGGIMSPYGNVLMSSRSEGSKDHISHKTKDAQENIYKLIEELGFTKEQIMEDKSVNRFIFNIRYLHKYQNDFKLNSKPQLHFTKKLI